MYKAKIDIGDYKKGETVPDHIAIVWHEMYLESPVEKVEKKGKGDKEDKKEDTPVKDSKEEKSSKDSSDAMLDDYLNRNENVVKKSISEDNLNKGTIEKLMNIENKDKKRKNIIGALKYKLGVI